MSDNWVVQNLQNALDTWNKYLSEIWQLITKSPEQFKGGSIWGVIVNIHDAVRAIGLALLVLFFVVGVMRTCGSFAEDAAQSGGVIPIHAERDGIDYLCCAGHKGLYGPMGTGMLITKNGEKLESLIQGGTGTRALELDQPREMPEYLESGTQNVPGILALGAGMVSCVMGSAVKPV